MKIAGSGSTSASGYESGSITQRYGSTDADPDPYQKMGRGASVELGGGLWSPQVSGNVGLAVISRILNVKGLSDLDPDPDPTHFGRKNCTA